MKQIIQVFLIILFVTMFNFFANEIGLFKLLDVTLQEVMFQARGVQDKKADPAIVIIFIDKPSLRFYQQISPTPRPLLRKLIEELDRKNAKVIALDVLLNRETNPISDTRLKSTIEKVKDKVVLVSGDRERKENILSEYAENFDNGYSYTKEGGLYYQVGLYQGTRSFAEEIYFKYKGVYPAIDDLMIPDSDENWIRISYRDQPIRLEDGFARYTVLSADNISNIEQSIVEEKIVLIGSGVEELQDALFTPFSIEENDYRKAFGVEIIADVLNMFLTSDMIIEPGSRRLFLSYLLVFSLMGFSFVIPRRMLKVLFLAIFTMVLLIAPFFAFLNFAVFIPVLSPVFSLYLLFFCISLYVASRHKRTSEILRNELRLAQEGEEMQREKVEKIEKELHDQERTLAETKNQLKKIDQFKNQLLKKEVEPYSKNSPKIVQLVSMINDISCIKGGSNLIEVYKIDGACEVYTGMKLKEIESQMKGLLFRTHKSWIINPKLVNGPVREIRKNKFKILVGEQDVDVSRDLVKDLKKIIASI